jgi:hypothetical protein
MMGRIHTAQSFGDCLSYCLEDKRLSARQTGRPGEVLFKDRAEIIGYNQCFGDRQQLVRQFNAVSHLHPNMSRPVFHISLSFPPGERLSKGALADIADSCARFLDFDRHQYVTILHKDTPQQHIHIVANRIGFNRHTANDSYSHGRIADYCRQAERLHHLVRELGPRRYQSQQQRQLPRHGMRLDRLREQIRLSLQAAKDYPAFEQKMQQQGYTVYKDRGIAFMDKKNVIIKGSEAGFSLKKIEETLNIRQQQEQTLRIRQRARQIENERDYSLHL